MTLDILIDGRSAPLNSVTDASVREIAPGLYSVIYKGRSYEVRIGNSGDAWRATIGDRTFALEVRDPRDAGKRSGTALAGSHQDVKAPMPGKVVRVLVREGDEVRAGQGLVVVEAMKMQNELKALRAGRVVRIAAKDGATVSAGDILATLE